VLITTDVYLLLRPCDWVHSTNGTIIPVGKSHCYELVFYLEMAPRSRAHIELLKRTELVFLSLDEPPAFHILPGTVTIPPGSKRASRAYLGDASRRSLRMWTIPWQDGDLRTPRSAMTTQGF
jgi:hypothetical protein